MSKKHYIAMAAMFRARIEQTRELMATGMTKNDGELVIATVCDLARDYALLAANDNRLFDARKFLTACGM